MSNVSSILAGDITLRPIASDEMSVVLGILRDPTVARWWGTYDLERVTAKYGQPDDDTVPYLIEYEGRVAGLIQYWEETDPDYRHASIDISLALIACWPIARPWKAADALARFLFEQKGHHRLTHRPGREQPERHHRLRAGSSRASESDWLLRSHVESRSCLRGC